MFFSKLVTTELDTRRMYETVKFSSRILSILSHKFAWKPAMGHLKFIFSRQEEFSRVNESTFEIARFSEILRLPRSLSCDGSARRIRTLHLRALEVAKICVYQGGTMVYYKMQE